MILDEDGSGNLATVSAVATIPDLDGMTTGSVGINSTMCATGATYQNSDGSTGRIAELKGLSRAAYGASSACKVVPEGGKVILTGLNGTDDVPFAAGQVLFAAPTIDTGATPRLGTIGTLATLKAHSGWAGNYMTAQIGVVSDNGSGVLELTVNIKIGIPI